MAASKTERLNLRIEKADEALFKQAAQVRSETLTQFLVESGRERAERLLADRSSFVVDADAWEEIVAAMDQPATARPELADLFSRPRPE
jgi:uncharacterized protein (DUF1778 family)